MENSPPARTRLASLANNNNSDHGQQQQQENDVPMTKTENTNDASVDSKKSAFKPKVPVRRLRKAAAVPESEKTETKPAFSAKDRKPRKQKLPLVDQTPSQGIFAQGIYTGDKSSRPSSSSGISSGTRMAQRSTASLNLDAPSDSDTPKIQAETPFTDRKPTAPFSASLLAGHASQPVLVQLPAVWPHMAPGAAGVIEGRVGEMEVRQSGKVQMRVGEVLFDVSEGVGWTFHQDLVLVDCVAASSVSLGCVRECLVVSPCLDQLLGVDVTLEAAAAEGDGDGVAEMQGVEFAAGKKEDVKDKKSAKALSVR